MHPTLRQAGPEESARIAEVVAAANPHLKNRISRFLRQGAQWHNASPVVCELRGRPVSCAVIFHRRIRWEGQYVPAGIVGAVATVPDQRGKGFASRVMRYCDEVQMRHGSTFGALFCVIPGFYARLGWTMVQERYATFEFPLQAPVPAKSEVRVKPFDPADIPSAIKALYAAASPPALSPVARDPGCWRQQSTWLREERDLAWIAYRNGRPAAYVRGMRREDRHLRIMEAVMLDAEEDAMLQALAKQTSSLSDSTLVECTCHASPEHPLMATLAKAGIRVRWKPTSTQEPLLMTKRYLGPEKPVRGSARPQIGAQSSDAPWHPKSWHAIDRL